MKKVPAVTDHVDIARLPRPADAAIHPVLTAGAEHVSSQNALVLMKLGLPGELDPPWHFALSPPAAAQLSRRLRKAVKAYLRQGDDNGDNNR